jgi:hypothetical protein
MRVMLIDSNMPSSRQLKLFHTPVYKSFLPPRLAR